MLNVDELPYLTADVPGIGGVIKSRPEDFRVDEVSLTNGDEVQVGKYRLIYFVAADDVTESAEA